MSDRLRIVRRNDPWCKSGKLRYDSKIEALITLRETRAKKRRNPLRQEMRAYECHLCAGWHLTSEEQRQTRSSGEH